MEETGYDKRIWILTRAENGAVVIEVEDNGVGTDEADSVFLSLLFR